MIFVLQFTYPVQESFPGNISIMEDFIGKTPAKVFPLMYGYGGAAAIGVAKKNVAAVLATFPETQALQKLDHLSGGDGGQAGHTTISIC